MKILVTGFKPFLNEPVNPTEEIIKVLASGEWLSGASSEFTAERQIITSVLPVEFEKSFKDIQMQVQMHQPDYIVMLGQAGGRAQIQLEKIALNWTQTDYPDESGFVPEQGPVILGEPLALMSKFPVDDVISKLSLKHQVGVSFSAGTYVCNHLYFQVRHGYPHIPSVFIHFPYLPEQVIGKSSAIPNMKLSDQIAFVRDLLQRI